ncbi:MAG TPA: hypothetical protein VJW20_13185 [Candidatus Angelobacter sp.]|nr:hypothetical protein [Candidatus Angelobacter sp.]
MPKKVFMVLVVLLAAGTAIAATTDSNQNATGVPAIRTYLLPDLSLKTAISPALLPSTAPQVENLAAGVPKRHGFCRCSCGFQCTSDADCGGTSCDPFITCCARQESPDAEWFSRSLDQASHKTTPPAAILKANCK